MRHAVTIRAVLPAALLMVLLVVRQPGQVQGTSENVWRSSAWPLTVFEWRWSATGSMNSGRYLHTATLLRDGRVLVAGGALSGENPVAAETYDPATGEWTATDDMATLRVGHTATRLSDGRVLVVGGHTPAGEALTSTELFDPATGAWTAAAGLHDARAGHAAALLPDGDVLVMGGEGDEGVTWAYERYDLASDTWTWGHMNKARAGHTATTLLDGRVLVVGGYVPGNVAELYDPTTGKWRYTGGRGADFAGWSTATLLPDGRVMVTGENASALYDAASESWGSYQGWQMWGHATALMGDGRVLISGGYDKTANFPHDFGYSNESHIYDPVDDNWDYGGSMTTYRAGHTATALLDGRVLVAGGELFGPLDSAELFQPHPLSEQIFVPAAIGWREE